MGTSCSPQLTFWLIGKQQVTVDFEGGRIVTDAGLLQIRDFERKMGIIREIARRFAERVLRRVVSAYSAGATALPDHRSGRHG